MKLTKQQLKQIIKEEIGLSEVLKPNELYRSLREFGEARELCFYKVVQAGKDARAKGTSLEKGIEHLNSLMKLYSLQNSPVSNEIIEWFKNGYNE